MSVELPELPEEITLPVGQTTRVDLPSYAGGGYRWSAAVVREPRVADVSIRTGGPAAEPVTGTASDQPPALFLAPVWLEVAGRAVGAASCRLQLARPFEAGKVAAEHVFRVIVVPEA